MTIVKIKRLTDMEKGEYCTLVINGKTVKRKVYGNKEGLYIKDNGKYYYKTALPLNEEVAILWNY